MKSHNSKQLASGIYFKERVNGKGKFQATVRVAGFGSKSQTFDTALEAEAWHRSTELQMRSGAIKGKSSSQKIKVASLFEYYKTHETPLKKGERRERARIEALMKENWMQKDVSELSAEDIAGYKYRRGEQVSGATINRELALISAVLEHAKNGRSIAVENKASDIKQLKENPGRNRLLSELEEKLLLEAVASSKSEGFLEFVVIALETAMRKGEIASLCWENINLQERTVLLPSTKNNTFRVVPLTTKARDVLRRLYQGQKGRVFRHSGEDPFKKAWYNALNRARANYVPIAQPDIFSQMIAFWSIFGFTIFVIKPALAWLRF